jgi:hypothetical protein
VTDLDQRIHTELERLVARAPVPPTVEDIAARRLAPSRRPLVVALAAVVVLLAAVLGAVALRQTAGDGSAPVAPPTTVSARPDLIVFLDPDATDAQVTAVRDRLASAPEVVDAVFVDQQQALDEFHELYRDDPGLLEAVTADVLPPSYRVDLVDPDAAPALIAGLERLPGVREATTTPVSRLPDDVAIPELFIDLPGWGDPEVVADEPSEPLEFENDQRLVAYRSPDAWLPMITVLTTTGPYGVGGERTVEVAGHEAQLDARFGGGSLAQVLGWEEDGETMAMTGYSIAEDELLAAAESLVRVDGTWQLAEVPDGLVEVYRTEQPQDDTGRNLDVQFRSSDGRDAELTASTAGLEQFWEAITDVLGEGVGGETVTVNGQPGLLTGDDGEYRVDWLERAGTVAMRLDLCCDLTRPEVDEVLAHLVEVNGRLAGD